MTYRFDRKTAPFLTVFERTQVIAERTRLLDAGKPPLVDPEGEMDTLAIATKELKAGKLSNMCVGRAAPGGGPPEAWVVTDLINLFDDRREK